MSSSLESGVRSLESGESSRNCEGRRIAVLGAGIAGLSAAVELLGKGFDVEVFESSPRAGGAIASASAEGFLYEIGPNSLMDTSEGLRRLIRESGAEPLRLTASPAAKNRYVIRDGKPVALPTNPVAFARTPLFSLRTKLRIFGEPFAEKHSTVEEESVASFFRRRLGAEVVDYAVDPFVAGIYAGNPEKLSVKYAFPRLTKMEAEHGSLFKALFHLRKASRKSDEPIEPEGKKKTKAGLYSFGPGLVALTDALAGKLGARLHLSSPVSGIESYEGGWRLLLPAGPSRRFAAVISALPAHALGRLSAPPRVEESFFRLRGIRYAPVAVVALGFRREDVAHALDGFGMLAPGKENRRILGTLFSSTLFTNRAPDGKVLLTTYVGGERRPELVARDDAELSDVTFKDLDELLGLRAKPLFSRIVRHPEAIPQYEIGYGRFLGAAEEVERRCPGIFLTGSWREGISVPDTAEAALRTATAVLTFLSKK